MLWAVVVVLVAGLPFIFRSDGSIRYLIDADVYRAGAAELLNTGALYSTAYDTASVPLPFTYPPFAALLFMPLAGLTPLGASLVIAVANLLLTGVFMWLIGHGLGLRRDILIGLVVLALLLEPVTDTLGYGQINLLLAVLVATDALMVRGPSRGFLTGIAVAIKLTPAVFVLYFLMLRQWRAVAGMAAGFLTATGFAWLLFPAQSQAYWSRVLADTSRIGNAEYASNQSLAGVFSRLGIDHDAVWLVSVVAVVGLVLVGLGGLARSYRGPRTDVAMLAASGMVATLASPVSWSHHWVWLVPAALWLAVVAHRRRHWPAGILSAGMFAAMLARPHWLMPVGDGQEHDWSWWQHLLGSSYTWLALMFVVYLAARRLFAEHRQDQKRVSSVPPGSLPVG